jgi:hypothetical protein
MLFEAFGCFLHGCFLHDNGEIGPLVDLAHFDDLVVGHRCSPGPFERLFPRTHLNDTTVALARQEPERRFLARRLTEFKLKSLHRLSIFSLRDDYRMKMQCAKQCCLPEDR